MSSPITRLAAGFAFVAISLAHTGAGAGDEGGPGTAPRSLPCLDRPIVVAYLHLLQDRVMDHWAGDADEMGNQSVLVRFRLAEDGTLLTYKLVSWTNRRIATAADLAMRHAGPFGSIPESATCIVGRSLEIRFENPY